ncbi:hypothetical protein TWF696_007376 [Orbilia brochopaga]|uniref:Dienelactone hydrolase domain-containing protein n=1 Tax=Orbilia brochopaga TaxID=3140254 RepID=A0AAV9UV34_9PEZI
MSIGGGMCVGCLQGALHEGQTTGTIEKVHGFDTYVARPQTSSPATIILLSDGFGWATPNARLTADRFASRTGTTVYLPDLTANHPLPSWLRSLPLCEIRNNWHSPHALLLKPWYLFWVILGLLPFRIVNGISRSHIRVRRFVAAVRNSAEGRVLGIAGFCWGGKHAFLLSAAKNPDRGTDTEDAGKEYLVDFAFAGHPSHVVLPGDVTHLVCPVSVAMGTEDFMNPLPFSKRMQELLAAKTGRAAGSELVLYDGGNHGFACRADLSDERLRDCAQGAEDQFVGFVARMAEKLRPGDTDTSNYVEC